MMSTLKGQEIPEIVLRIAGVSLAIRVLLIERKAIIKSKRLLIGLRLAITLVAGVGLALGGCVTPSKELKDSGSSAVVPEPKTRVSAIKASNLPAVSRPEDEIKSVIKELERAWNEKDKDKYLAFFSPDAKILTGGRRKEEKIVDKQTYEKMFPALFNEHGSMRYGDPNVNVIGNKAEIEMVCNILDNDDVWLTKRMWLERVHGAWLVRLSTFEVHFKGPGDPRERPRNRGSIISD